MGTSIELEGGTEPVHLALGRPDTDRDQSVILVPYAWTESIRPAAAAVKARDELAALGLDGGPRQPNNSNYPGIGQQEKNELAPTTGP
jgi:hypothetical protein